MHDKQQRNFLYILVSIVYLHVVYVHSNVILSLRKKVQLSFYFRQLVGLPPLLLTEWQKTRNNIKYCQIGTLLRWSHTANVPNENHRNLFHIHCLYSNDIKYSDYSNIITVPVCVKLLTRKNVLFHSCLFYMSSFIVQYLFLLHVEFYSAVPVYFTCRVLQCSTCLFYMSSFIVHYLFILNVQLYSTVPVYLTCLVLQYSTCFFTCLVIQYSTCLFYMSSFIVQFLFILHVAFYSTVPVDIKCLVLQYSTCLFYKSSFIEQYLFILHVQLYSTVPVSFTWRVLQYSTCLF